MGTGSAEHRAASPDGLVRVVIADDYDDIRLMVRLILTGAGRFEVVAEARDGQEAIDAVAAHQPDVVMLDLAMPVMSGLEAVPGIREVSPDTRILVFTGFPEETIEWRDAGIDGFIGKGASVAELVAAVRAVADTA